MPVTFHRSDAMLARRLFGSKIYAGPFSSLVHGPVMAPSSRQRAVASPGALHFLAQRLNLGVTSKDGLSIRPGKRWSNGAGVSDDRAGRGLIAQVGPLQVQGVSTVDADARQRLGGRASERRFSTLVAIHVEEGELVACQDHGLVPC